MTTDRLIGTAVALALASIGTLGCQAAAPAPEPGGDVARAVTNAVSASIRQSWQSARRNIAESAELMAEASSIGAEFQELSNQLRMCPNVVAIDGLIPPNSSKPVFSLSLFEPDRLIALVSEIRQTISRKNEIQERLQDLGILDAYGQFRY